MPKRNDRRADQLLLEVGLAETAARAGALVMSGRVMATGPDGKERKVEKPGERLAEGTRFRLAGEQRVYASRGGHKLAAALEAFAIDPAGKVCADIGLSTGGFTDVLLGRGAARVHGVDVGYGLVDWRLRGDPRLVLHERTNARHLPPGAFGEPVSLVVVDLSFIRLEVVLPALVGQLAPEAELVLLVKPQFELSPDDVPGGVVRDDDARQRARQGVERAAAALGLAPAGHVDSPVAGADGNREILLHLVRRGSPLGGDSGAEGSPQG